MKGVLQAPVLGLYLGLLYWFHSAFGIYETSIPILSHDSPRELGLR